MNELITNMIFAYPPYNLSNDGITCYAGRMVTVNKLIKSQRFEIVEK
jgi:site-specific DNA-methyltransferase (adenine-specific)